MKIILFNLLFAAVFPFLLPSYLIRMVRRGGYKARLADRFALYPREIVSRFARAGKRPVWIHAVSVGEVQVAGQLMKEWRKAEPDVWFCFSTTSSTGWKIAEKEIAGDDVLIYNPLDFPNFVKSALKTVRPRAIVLTESEIWPVFIDKAAKYGIKLFLINARISDRSAPRYKAMRFLFKDVFAGFTKIFAQSALDRDRLLSAGAPEEIIEVTGSFKFDVARRNPKKEAEMREWIGEGRILLGGSTWPEEDKMMLEAWNGRPDCKLVIAPRHFEKADKIEENIVAAGYRCVRRSRGDKATGEGKEVFLADTTGELMGLYGIADVVFVGKSVYAVGSQNMIEPCFCGKKTVVGPHTENFRSVMADLLQARAIVQTKDAAETKECIAKMCNGEMGELVDRAKEACLKRCGVVERCVKDIRGRIRIVTGSEA